MKKSGIENPIEGKEAKPKMGKLRQPRLPETGEGNKPFQVWDPDENGRVTVRVLDTFFKLGFTIEGGKFKGYVVTDERDSRIYKSAKHRLPDELKEKAIKQGFARLYEYAEERHPILKQRRIWAEHKGRQRDL